MEELIKRIEEILLDATCSRSVYGGLMLVYASALRRGPRAVI